MGIVAAVPSRAPNTKGAFLPLGELSNAVSVAAAA